MNYPCFPCFSFPGKILYFRTSFSFMFTVKFAASIPKKGLLASPTPLCWLCLPNNHDHHYGHRNPPVGVLQALHLQSAQFRWCTAHNLEPPRGGREIQQKLVLGAIPLTKGNRLWRTKQGVINITNMTHNTRRRCRWSGGCLLQVAGPTA